VNVLPAAPLEQETGKRLDQRHQRAQKEMDQAKGPRQRHASRLGKLRKSILGNRSKNA